MLTINSQIPTSARRAIRNMAKSHPDWANYLATLGIPSANVLNRQILAFVLMHQSLTQQVEALLASNPVSASNPASDDNDTSDDTSDEGNDTMTENEVIDARINEQLAAAGAFSVDGVLATVDQLLGPAVRREIVSALSPVVDAANRGPVEVERVVEVERIVEVEAGSRPRPVIAKARRDKQVTIRSLLTPVSRAKDAWRDKMVTLWTGAPSPAVDPFYVPDHQQAAIALTAIERCTNFWAFGPAASGKSTLPEWLAALLGRPFVKFLMRKQIDMETLVGSYQMGNGATYWEDGALVKAIRAPGTIILFDELTLAPAAIQAIVQGLTDDHRSITLPTGEVVKAADGVVFCVADNTAGSGDEGGLYAGTNISNAALLTRFKRFIPMGFLPIEREAEALANHTACPIPAAMHLAKFVADARSQPSLAGVVISLRQMIGFVQMVQDGFKSKDAFTICISSRMPATERATIEAMIDLQWNNTFEAMLAGNKPSPAVQPSNSAAANAFPPVSENF